MNIDKGIAALIIAVVGASAPLSASADDPGISLKHGVYVSVTARCKGAANADILSWDGTGFAGAHSSRCTSKIVRKSGARYQVDTACLAVGDGTEGAAGAGASDAFLLTRLSATRFDVLKDKQARRTYRWCGVSAP